jgi:hypothetical protein
VTSLSDKELSDEVYKAFFNDGEKALETVNKVQLTEGTLHFFLKAERENAVNVYEGKLKVYD